MAVRSINGAATATARLISQTTTSAGQLLAQLMTSGEEAEGRRHRTAPARGQRFEALDHALGNVRPAAGRALRQPHQGRPVLPHGCGDGGGGGGGYRQGNRRVCRCAHSRLQAAGDPQRPPSPAESFLVSIHYSYNSSPNGLEVTKFLISTSLLISVSGQNCGWTEFNF
jgi:hypothetical protein